MCWCVAWMGSSQPWWVWKKCLPRHGEDQLLHWHNRCCMECCQRLHPQHVVFAKQSSSLVREMLPMEICESTYPSPAENHFNFEEPVLKGRRKRWLTCSDEISAKPTRNANFAFGNDSFAVAKTHFFSETLFLRARFPVRRVVFVSSSLVFLASTLSVFARPAPLHQKNHQRSVSKNFMFFFTQSAWDTQVSIQNVKMPDTEKKCHKLDCIGHL